MERRFRLGGYPVRAEIMTLTKVLIETAGYVGKSYRGKSGRKSWSQCVVWDETVSGLGLRISPKNRKTFVISYRSGGRKRLKTLGKVGPLSLSQARAEARRFLAAALDAPATNRPRSATGAPVSTSSGFETFGDLARAYVDYRIENNERTWRAERLQVHRYIVPILGKVTMDRLSARDLVSLRTRIRATHPKDGQSLARLVGDIFAWRSANRDRATALSKAETPVAAASSPSERSTLPSPQALENEAGAGPSENYPPQEPEEHAAAEATAARSSESPLEPIGSPPAQRSLRLPLVRGDAATAGVLIGNRSSAPGRLLGQYPEGLGIETESNLRVGEVVRFRVVINEAKSYALQARVSSSRLTRTVRTASGEVRPVFHTLLFVTRIDSE